VPTVYVRLLELSADEARAIGARMRLFVSGSAPLPAHVFEQFRERFGHTILERYGMSETLMLASNLLEGERRAGTVGYPLPGGSLAVRDRDGSTELAYSQLGWEEIGGSNEEQHRQPERFCHHWVETMKRARARVAQP
jgi:malonyl-CoA/methylmalonyl-CoA synthetase